MNVLAAFDTKSERMSLRSMSFTFLTMDGDAIDVEYCQAVERRQSQS